MNTKLCKDCRHYQEHGASSISDLCRHPDLARQPDMVRGEPQLVFCNVERQTIRCGSHGALWAPAPGVAIPESGIDFPPA